MNSDNLLCPEHYRADSVYRVSIRTRWITLDNLYADGADFVTSYVLERQPINPATGKGWQAWRPMQEFDNEFKARRAWLYAGR